MVEYLKDLGSLVKDLGVPDSGSIYFAFKTHGLDISGRPVYGIEGKLHEEGKDYISIMRSTGELVIVPHEQIAYISPKPLPTNLESLPPELVSGLTKSEESLFNYLLQHRLSSNQELINIAKLNPNSLRWHILNLRKKLKETPYGIINVRGRGYKLRFTPV